MPDWFYRTVAQPLLFQLPAATARDLALGLMGLMGRSAPGRFVIDLLGHMRPDPRLRRTLQGIELASSVGLGVGIDENGVAHQALARFGVGFLEVGPITCEPQPASGAVERRPDQEAIWYPAQRASPGLAEWTNRLARSGRPNVAVVARLACQANTPADEATRDCLRMVEALAPYVQVFVLPTAGYTASAAWSPDQWRVHLHEFREGLRRLAPTAALWIGLPADLDPGKVDALVGPAVELGDLGVLVDGSVAAAPTGRLIGGPAREPALHLVRHLREHWGAGLVIVAGGGIHQPEDALVLREAGTDLVLIDSGLVYSGPGLPKRINKALLAADAANSSTATGPAPPAAMAAQSWFWTTLLGISMLGGGLLAFAIAATRVVLPYDEALAGMTREQLAAINPRLLSFMAHDRVSLAGTMIAVGVLYLFLSLCGSRRGAPWARVAVLVSAFAGFGSFFLFLGFGYFDPFHAFVTATLFQFLLLALHSPPSAKTEDTRVELREDRRWRLCQWGQLLFIVHGVLLIGAGSVISTVGVTSVFVHEDLEFMGTTAEALTAAHPRLVPLVAHDRASFGGMLIASGLAVLLPSLWGFRQGRAWLWWALLSAGAPAYAAAIGVHIAVGYTSLWHLTPAFGGTTLLVLGLWMTYPFLCQLDPSNDVTLRRRTDLLASSEPRT